VLTAEVSEEHAVGHLFMKVLDGMTELASVVAESNRSICGPSEQEYANAAFRIFAYNGNLQRAEKQSQKHTEYVNMCWETPLGKV
jgi:hypothetical protein